MRARHGWMAAAAVALAIAGCRRGGDAVRVEDAWIRLAPVPGRPSAGYLTVRGGAEPARLVAIDSPAAGSTELHESMKGMGAHAMVSMRRLDGIDVPARGAATLAPGGYHLMMFGLSPKLKPGATVAMTVRFAKGPPVTAVAKVVGAGDAAPY